MGSTLIPPAPHEMTQPLADPAEAQREAALKLANDARTAKRILTDRISALPAPASIQMVCDVLDDVPEVLDGMRIHRLLRAVRGIGDGSALKLCDAASVPELTRLRDLRPGERAALIAVLRLRSVSGARARSFGARP